jgi:hypothetical protein
MGSCFAASDCRVAVSEFSACPPHRRGNGPGPLPGYRSGLLPVGALQGCPRPRGEGGVRRPCFCRQGNHCKANYSPHQRVTYVMISSFDER